MNGARAMQLDECQTKPFVPPRASTTPIPHEGESDADGQENSIDPLELEALALLLEHSLKVHTSHHFHCWTQGLLQNLIQHDLLICALRKGDSASFHVDTFSTTASDPSVISNLFSQDTSLVPHLIKTWEDNRLQPVVFDMDKAPSMADSGLARELQRFDIHHLLVHGTYDTFGRPTSLFIFACPRGSVTSRHRLLAGLLTPSLHATWVHTQFVRPGTTETAGCRTNAQDLLTSREHEILGWIYRGKSNIEIAMILGISPLTVKNHVQKILRRLDVLNRAQAVGKALSLRILDCSAPC